MNWTLITGNCYEEHPRCRKHYMQMCGSMEKYLGDLRISFVHLKVTVGHDIRKLP